MEYLVSCQSLRAGIWNLRDYQLFMMYYMAFYSIPNYLFHSTPIYNHSSCCLMNLTLSFRLLMMNFRSCPIGSSCDPGTPHYYVPTTVFCARYTMVCYVLSQFGLFCTCFFHGGKMLFPLLGLAFFPFLWKVEHMEMLQNSKLFVC